MSSAQRYVATVQHDAATDDYYIEFTPEMLATAGWQPGDVLVWTDLGDHTWQLSKQPPALT